MDAAISKSSVQRSASVGSVNERWHSLPKAKEKSSGSKTLPTVSLLTVSEPSSLRLTIHSNSTPHPLRDPSAPRLFNHTSVLFGARGNGQKYLSSIFMERCPVLTVRGFSCTSPLYLTPVHLESSPPCVFQIRYELIVTKFW